MNDNGLLEGGTSPPSITDEGPAFDTFMRDEGLDLLTAYRAIENESVRRNLRDLVAKIAARTVSKPRIV